MRECIKYAGAFVLVCSLLAAIGHPVVAQGTVTVKLDSVDMSRFPQLTVYATVVDENGLPISGLAADRFELVENGQTSFPPQTAQAITNDKAATSVLVLVDLSETMRGDPLESAKAATANFLEKLLNEGNDPDRAAFVGFGRNVDIKQTNFTDEAREVAFTNDRGQLLNVVNFVEVDRNAGTPLYDAIYRAIKITAQQAGRRAIIVMTDGSDVGSTLKQDDPIDEARRQHIPIFPIGLSNSRLDKTYLARLAELTGGQFQEAPTPDELEQKFVQVLGQLKVQYMLTYQSRLPEVDGQYHSLLLRVNTVRGQGFDEIKLQVGQVTPAPTTMPKPGETSAPPPLTTPVPGDTTEPLDGVITWVRQNTLLASGILAAALLLLLMVIIFVILLIRRRSAAEPDAWEAAPAEWPASPMDYPQKSDGVGASSADAVPTISPAAPPTVPTPSAAPSIAPAAKPFVPPPPPPKRAAPPPPAPAAGPAEPTGAGGTMLIQRGPKIKVMGILVDRKQSSKRYDIDKPTVTVGRAPGNTLVLDHATVSRQHATIKLEKDEFRLYDLGSANGTFVGDKRVREPVTLEDGAIVRFGEQEFTFKRVSLE
jgi:VWFA-related protein